MDYTLNEINKHKNNINFLSNQLLNTYNIDEEISLNNEIKNIKKNSMMNQVFQNNNMNFFNPMINPNNMIQNQFIQQQMMNQQLNIKKKKKHLIFRLFLKKD